MLLIRGATIIALQLEDPFINAQGEPDLAQFKMFRMNLEA